eukprot:gene16603-20290_t
MTLGGLAIAIGELVDDAVVDVENIFSRLRENREKGNPRSVFDVVVSASQEVRSGIVYATMTIVLVFVPLFALFLSLATERASNELQQNLDILLAANAQALAMGTEAHRVAVQRFLDKQPALFQWPAQAAS